MIGLVILLSGIFYLSQYHAWLIEAKRDSLRAQGEVIAVGPGRIEKGDRIPMEVRVGDKVIYGKYSGQNVTIDGTEVVIIKVTDLYGKLA